MGGPRVIEALAQEFGLWKKLRRIPSLDARTRKSRGYSPGLLVAQLLYSLCSGGASMALGDALHAIVAAEFHAPNQPDRLLFAEEILKDCGVEGALPAGDAAAMADEFRSFVEDRWRPRSVIVECPFQYRNPSGQWVNGFIDLLLETDAGWVVIDHKRYPRTGDRVESAGP